MTRLLAAACLALSLSVPAMAQDRIRISSDWGEVTARLADTAATRALLAQLPLTLDMQDHLRQEKTGTLPTALPDTDRQRGFSAGTLGLWAGRDFVIYYRSGQVPAPGISILGEVTGDISLFDRPGNVTVKLQRIE